MSAQERPQADEGRQQQQSGHLVAAKQPLLACAAGALGLLAMQWLDAGLDHGIRARPSRTSNSIGEILYELGWKCLRRARRKGFGACR